MSIGDGAITTDEFGKITQVNPIALQILGFNENEMVGEWFPKRMTIVDEKDRPLSLIDRPITRAFLTGRPVSEKAFYRRKSGQRFPVAINVSPIILNGRPIGAIEVFRDITLEQEVDRMKSEFISLASHQLRTPLSAIMTYSHMLVDGYMGKLTEAQKRSLRTVISAANRMNELISTLLNITRIESGTIAVSLKAVAIDKLAEEVLKEVSLMASDHDVKLSLERKGHASNIVRTDSLIVKEVLSNLITNAIKYTPANGSVVVTVQARSRDILVTVLDTGWGIPDYAQDQVFSKFFRAHNIVKRETTGTGLGLYLVKGLLEELGGKIWFTSTEGQGTTFSFTLPRPVQSAKPRKNK